MESDKHKKSRPEGRLFYKLKITSFLLSLERLLQEQQVLVQQRQLDQQLEQQQLALQRLDQQLVLELVQRQVLVLAQEPFQEPFRRKR